MVDPQTMEAIFMLQRMGISITATDAQLAIVHPSMTLHTLSQKPSLMVSAAG
jgi:hypothetical protein